MERAIQKHREDPSLSVLLHKLEEKPQGTSFLFCLGVSDFRLDAERSEGNQPSVSKNQSKDSLRTRDVLSL